MNPLEAEFWSSISHCNRILISGCGGGYDFMQGLPLYFALKSQSKEVFLGNMTFSELSNADGEVILRESNPGQTISSMIIKSSTQLNHRSGYFPEKYLCEWFHEVLNEEIEVFAFRRRGLDKITKSYQIIIERYQIDAIVLVDGGSDSLMAGDENELGTPMEDMLSMFGVFPIKIPKFLVCLGIGADRYHGVSDCSTLRAIAELTKLDGFLGMIGLTPDMPEVQGYEQACQYVESKMPSSSIVGFYVRSAIQGKFGNYNILDRTAKQKLFVYHIMSQYYFFDLEKVVRRVKYRDYCEDTKNATDFILGIDVYRREIEANGPIPIEEIPTTKDI